LKRQKRSQANNDLVDLDYVWSLTLPKTVIPLAKKAGNGDPVLGASAAYRQVRSEIRSYLKYVRYRDQLESVLDLKLASALRSMGYAGNRQNVYPTDQRPVESAMWPEGYGIPGGVHINYEFDENNCDVDFLNLSVQQLCCEFLYRFPQYNKAILQDKIYKRDSPEILFNMYIKNHVVSPIIDFSTWLPSNYKGKLNSVLRGVLKANKSEYKSYAEASFIEWCKTGFIVSSAGMMLSCPNTTFGQAPLVKGNGIPLSALIHRPKHGKVWFCGNADHRVFDGQCLADLYEFMDKNLMDRMRENIDEYIICGRE